VDRRSYTPEQAERTLPFVRRVVEDIVAEHVRWRGLVAELELANSTRTVGAPAPRAEELEHDVLAAAKRIDGYAAELTPLGLAVQSYELGLVDFPAVVDGRPAFLCWRLGEPAVRFWHDRGAGLIGRRPLAPRAA
jgi:hypothetical protein